MKQINKNITDLIIWIERIRQFNNIVQIWRWSNRCYNRTRFHNICKTTITWLVYLYNSKSTKFWRHTFATVTIPFMNFLEAIPEHLNNHTNWFCYQTHLVMSNEIVLIAVQKWLFCETTYGTIRYFVTWSKIT